MKRLMIGLAAMAFVWTVQAQAAEVTWQKDIKPPASQDVPVAQQPQHIQQAGYQPQQVNYRTGHAPGYGHGHGQTVQEKIVPGRTF